jgi:hypothetical protein
MSAPRDAGTVPAVKSKKNEYGPNYHRTLIPATTMMLARKMQARAFARRPAKPEQFGLMPSYERTRHRNREPATSTACGGKGK